MKQLTKLLTILLMSTICFQSQAQRFLQISDEFALDTKGAMTQSLKYFFDEYGFLRPNNSEKAVMRVGLLKGTDSVVMIMSKAEFDHPESATRAIKFIETDYLLKIANLMQQREGELTPYGTPRKAKILASGNHSLTYNSPYIRYSGSWSGGTGCNCKYANQTTDYAEIVFSGTSIKVVGENLETHGIAKFDLDGDISEVDQYSDVKKENQVIFEKSGLENKQHVLRISPTGEKNPLASNTWVVIKSIQVSNEVPVSQPEIIYRDSIIYKQPKLIFNYPNQTFEHTIE